MTTIILRDTISGEPLEVSESTAERYLNHPTFGKRLERVRVAKPEVLADRSGEGYEALRKEELADEIEARNAGRDEDSKIVPAAPGNKADLIAALEADDRTEV